MLYSARHMHNRSSQLILNDTSIKRTPGAGSVSAVFQSFCCNHRTPFKTDTSLRRTVGSFVPTVSVLERVDCIHCCARYLSLKLPRVTILRLWGHFQPFYQDIQLLAQTRHSVTIFSFSSP